MTIIYICDEYPPKQVGGIGMFTKLNAERLVAGGHKIIVFGYGNDNTESIAMENGVKVIRLVQPKFGKNPIFNFAKTLFAKYAYFRSLKNHIRNSKPDIIESYDWSGPLLFKIKGVKLIVRLHGSNTASNEYLNKKRSVLLYLIEKRSLKIADKIVSVSNHIAEQTRKSFKMNFEHTTIYNGVDVEKFKNYKLRRDPNKIILVGRMHDYKGFKELFNSMNRVFENNDEVHFDIICTVNQMYKDNLLERVDEKYHDRIYFIGRVENGLLPQKYNEANLSILPSLTEAFPIIPLESMACGTPVIMSNRFSCNEIIDDNEDGFLVNVLEPEELANKILNILSDQNRIENMRIKAIQKIVDNFEINQIVKNNTNFYKSIISA